MNKEFEKMRAEFEDWYSALIGKTANLMRNDAYYDRPRYGNAKTDIAWLAWQASRKQAEWQPIETAPKDGSHILLMATQHQMLYQKPEMIVGYWASGWWSNGGHTLSHVTHWMPLPQPPAVQKE